MTATRWTMTLLAAMTLATGLGAGASTPGTAAATQIPRLQATQPGAHGTMKMLDSYPGATTPQLGPVDVETGLALTDSLQDLHILVKDGPDGIAVIWAGGTGPTHNSKCKGETSSAGGTLSVVSGGSKFSKFTWEQPKKGDQVALGYWLRTRGPNGEVIWNFHPSGERRFFTGEKWVCL